MCDELVRELAAVAVQIIDLGKGRRRGDMPERLEPGFDLGPLNIQTSCGGERATRSQ